MMAKGQTNMDIRSFDAARAERGDDPTAGGIGEATAAIGGDERRMHVRAYNHWVSLLKGRRFPSVADVDPARNADFGAHGVLLDFSQGADDPAISFLGESLREESGVDAAISRVGQVPPRSLLSRLTDHSRKIIASRAPIGFEAEFVGIRGHNTLYRGILLPFSSDGETIDHVYGVINWKEIVGVAEQASLDAELAAAVRSAPQRHAGPAIWADGPSAGLPDVPATPGAGDANDPLASVILDVPAEEGQLVVLLARAKGGGVFDVLGAAGEDADLATRVAAAIR